MGRTVSWRSTAAIGLIPGLFLALAASPAVACTDTLAYVSDAFATSVTVVDTTSNTVGSSATVGSAGQGIAFMPDGALAYVSVKSGDIEVIDTATRTVVTTIFSGSSVEGLSGIAITPDGAYAYVGHAGINAVVVIDTSSNTVLTTIPLGDSPKAVAIAPDGATAYVTDNTSGDVSVIDVASNTVSTTVSVGSSAYGIAITPDGAYAYVSVGVGSSVAVIDLATNSVVTTIPVGSFPRSIALTPDGALAYVGNNTAATVSVISTATNSVVSTLAVGSSPIRVAVSADGARAYITNAGSGTISVIDTASNTVAETIPIGGVPFAIAMAPSVDPERADLTGFADASGDSVPDFAAFVCDSDSRRQAKLHSGNNGDNFGALNFLNPAWAGIALDTIDDANGDGTADDPAVAMLLVEPATGKMLVQARDAATGASVAKISFLNADWTPVDIVVINDTDGDGNSNDASIGVLAVSKTTDKILMQVRSLSTGAKIATRSFLNPNWTPVAAAAAPRQGQTPLLGVLGIESGTEKNLVQTRQLSDGVLVDNQAFLNTDWTATDIAAVEDGNSDGTADDPAWLVLANNNVKGTNLVQARYANTGSRISNIKYLTDDYLGLRLATSADISGNSREEASVYGKRLSDDKRIIQIRDFASSSRTGNIFP